MVLPSSSPAPALTLPSQPSGAPFKLPIGERPSVIPLLGGPLSLLPTVANPTADFSRDLKKRIALFFYPKSGTSVCNA